MQGRPLIPWQSPITVAGILLPAFVFLFTGAPPAGLSLLCYLQETGALRPAAASFPVMGAAAGGLATCEVAGDRVLHVFCGAGGLTKLMASQVSLVCSLGCADLLLVIGLERMHLHVQVHGCMSYARTAGKPFAAASQLRLSWILLLPQLVMTSRVHCVLWMLVPWSSGVGQPRGGCRPGRISTSAAWLASSSILNRPASRAADGQYGGVGAA